MREKLWNLLDKARFDYCYLEEYRSWLMFCRFVAKSVEGMALAVLAGGLAGLFDAGPAVLGIALMLGAIAVVCEQSMLTEKLAALAFALPEMSLQLRKLHGDWLSVNSVYSYEEKAIADIFAHHMEKLETISERYLDRLNVPASKRLAARASAIAALYASKLS